MLKHLLLGLCLLSLTAASPTYGAGIAETIGLSPFWDWKQIETEHFRITFPAELADTAQRAAGYFEEAHSVLSKKLHWEAHYKAPILLVDNTDSANGMTSPVGRFGIALYVTPPDNFFSTAYYDDWLRLLCFHEYTHFLNMDTTRGFYQAGRVLFGDVLLPNSLWPSWMLEGLAVYMETRFTHSGRGRSPYYEMILRAAVEANVLDTGKFFTLDRINSLSVPYFPGGEAVYLFGYSLMNEVASSQGEDALGAMSYNSAARVPYFINGNLSNITGHDWYYYWDKFVKETRARTTAELERIRAQPVTVVHPLTRHGYQVLGSAFSPDGKWLAYTEETLAHRPSLYLRNLKTGEVKRLGEKILGAQLAFTADSKYLLFSSLRRESEYYQYSELGAYSLERDSVTWLSSKLRARDPDISRDGKSVVFTLTEGAKTGLALGSLDESADRIALRAVHRIFPAEKYDVASSPKFSGDGKTVFFSLHRNGRFSEELMALDLDSGRPSKPRVLVENGKFNRFPAVTPRGDLYFVSDLSGVDNLYLYRKDRAPKLFTNLTTGISFPSADAEGGIYGAVFSYTGWDFARIDPLPREAAASAVTIAPAPGPQSDADSRPKPTAASLYPIDEYSLVPSIWPRGWIPYAYWGPGNFSFGEEVAGFDAVDRQRYLLNLGYDTLSASADWFGEYQNRSLGATVTLSAGNQLSYTNYSNNSLYSYTRDLVASLGVSYPIFWTYSSLTPSLTFNTDRTSYYYPGLDTPTVNYDTRSGFLPSLDAVLTYSDAEQSRLAIAPEEGRDTILGGRYYINNGGGTQAVKGLLADAEHLRIGNSHAVLSPSVQASYTTANPQTNQNLNSDVALQGRLPVLIGDFPNTSLSRLPIRGYPGMTYFVKSAVVSALDLQIPIAAVYRGAGTDPFFLDQIYGFGFGEATYLPFNEPKFLPSAGGGLKASLELLIQIPITVSVEYHYGFATSAGGGGELFAAANYTGFAF